MRNTPTDTEPAYTVLPASEWWPRLVAHRETAQKRTAERLYRQDRGLKEPIEDFLYEYYPLRPGRFSVWHPGLGTDGCSVALAMPTSKDCQTMINEGALSTPAATHDSTTPHHASHHAHIQHEAKMRRFAKQAYFTVTNTFISEDAREALEAQLNEPSNLTPTPMNEWLTMSQRRWYETRDINGISCVAFNIAAYMNDRARGVAYLYRLLRAIQERDGFFGCLGWHEWAMAYFPHSKGAMVGDGDTDAPQQSSCPSVSPFTRHALPLRLGQNGTNRIVEQATIRCSHYDAFRFFSPDATSRNQIQPCYERVLELDQPGCIHVNMDLLRTCIQLGPIVPGELVIQCYDLALRARKLDMAASPYDCTSLGLDPILIETPEGKAQYIRDQRELSEAARPLRAQIIDILRPIMKEFRIDSHAA